MAFFTEDFQVFDVLVKIAWRYNHKIFNTLFYIEIFYPGSNRYKIKHNFHQYFANTFFLEHLCTMVSLGLIEKYSIATTRYSFKDCILACKIRNQMHINFEKRKFHKQSVVILLNNGCSVDIFSVQYLFLYLWL